VSRQRAVQAFEDFTGETPTKLTRSRLPDHDVTGWKMGPMVGVAYEARRDGQVKQYFHEFKKSARPNLVAQDDGRQLYIEGGRYKVTDRGIEDMPLLFAVNPSPRSGRKGSKKGKSAMARRATSRRRRRSSQVAIFKANPVRRRRRRTHRSRARSRTRTVYMTNPARRRRRYRRNPVARRSHRRRSFRRNPTSGLSMGSLGQLIVPAAGVGLGAIGAEVIMGYLPIPANLKTGVAREVTKGLVGIAAGWAIGKVLRQQRLGRFIQFGAVVIAVHDAAKAFLASRLTNVPGLNGMGYMRTIPGINGMGFVNPGSTIRLGYMPTVPGINGMAPIPNAAQPGGESHFQA
jgi:hypothetical protein